MTEDDYRNYRQYTKTIKGLATGIITHPGDFISLGRENALKFFLDNSTGDKYGPHKDISPRYHEKKKVLYGYSYKKDENNISWI